MDTEMIPKFTSKDEEINYWKLLSLKYKKRYVCVCVCVLIVLKTSCFLLVEWFTIPCEGVMS